MDHIVEENSRLKLQLNELKRENKALRAQIARLQADHRPDSGELFFFKTTTSRNDNMIITIEL